MQFVFLFLTAHTFLKCFSLLLIFNLVHIVVYKNRSELKFDNIEYRQESNLNK